MDKRIRKLMTKHKALHPREDVNRLYVSTKEGGRGLTRIQDSVNALIQQLEDSIKNLRGKLITVNRSNITQSSTEQKYTESKKREKKTTVWTFQATNKQNLTQENVDIAKGNFKRESEYLLIAAQNNVIRTNYVKAKVDNTQ